MFHRKKDKTVFRNISFCYYTSRNFYIEAVIYAHVMKSNSNATVNSD
jgi:hypothetical protein